MYKKLLFTFAGILFLMLSCTKSTEEETNVVLDPIVEIRLKNTSSFAYADVKTEIGVEAYSYGNLIAGEASAYHTFDYAYSYAFIELKINGEIFTIQPIDFIGETKLNAGKYTYEINATTVGSQYDRLSITLIED